MTKINSELTLADMDMVTRMVERGDGPAAISRELNRRWYEAGELYRMDTYEVAARLKRNGLTIHPDRRDGS